MAKETLSRAYSNAIIDLNAMTITEMPKKKDEEEKVFKLLEELADFAGDDKRVEISLKQVSVHEPLEEDEE